ncbi:tryptophanyl-tRNA synthetase [Methanoregula boonei 6A8]|uniref:tryptophan--tRNA ligase n=1 Tax=Methanoregula boonei (strain DSM 21154 / JCM 14090 / 6A8) TaxID=456442 RepID=A7I613_METB6|nr:tryptophan--tRNA ligase [Methanoregula boonei]ABS55174.1 tryptophanyl-tRNA synthetase [Methanoregula boonei 6A8]
MTEPQINPWSSTPTLDVEKTFAEFGIDPIAPVLPELPEVPYFMRRGIVVGQRDYLPIARAIRNHTPFHLLTGFMPSGHPHLGHLMLMREVVWHVQQGANGYVTIADREAYAVRGLSWEKCREYGKEYLSCLYALGFEGQTYFQSKNSRLKDLAFEAATKVNFSELTAIYGFTPETALAHADSVITQVADILYPQVEREPAPTLVPVGIDQDPHIRLTRGIAHKFRMFTVEEREDYVSVRSKNAPEAALDAVKKAFPHAKKYEGHVDIKGAACADVSTKVRDIERACGGYAFYTPSSTYHIFLPGLTGGKMSSSIPESLISFYEPEAAVRKKVMSALTGGRMTLEEQRRLGGEPEKCTLYLLNMFHMITDDAKLAELHRKCRSGEITCGQCKKETAERVVAFLKDFREKMDVAAETIEV